MGGSSVKGLTARPHSGTADLDPSHLGEMSPPTGISVDGLLPAQDSTLETFETGALIDPATNPASAPPDLSSSVPPIAIVIPTLNENGNVPRLVNELESLMPQEPEIIIVDDGSSDGTPDSVLKLRAQFPRIHLIQRNGRKGIGSAVREGIQFALANTASGYIVTMDADGSHNPDELPGLLAAARGVDFVQGSRYVEGGAIRGWPPLRRLLSIVGNNACRILFQTGFHEHTTFYRVFNRDCAEHIVERVVDDGYAWGVRSLLESLGAGFRTLEFPITFVERTNGKSKLGIREIGGWIASVARLFVRDRGS